MALPNDLLSSMVHAKKTKAVFAVVTAGNCTPWSGSGPDADLPVSVRHVLGMSGIKFRSRVGNGHEILFGRKMALRCRKSQSVLILDIRFRGRYNGVQRL